MTGEWIECKLADACASIDYGLTASAADHQNGPKFLRITDIVSGHIDWKTVPHVTIDEEAISKYQLYDGDIVIARTGASTGASAYIKKPPKAIFASYLVRLQAKPEFEPRFLAYYMKSDQFWSFIHGVLGDKSAQPNASASTMVKAPLRLPKEKSEQRAIAHILGTLDDKIELNRRMNETLEQMARAIFKSWFVDATQDGLPKGWRAGALGDIADNPRRGVQPEGIDFSTPYIGLEHMPRRCIALSEWEYARKLESNKFEFRRGEVLFGKLRPYFHKVGIAPLDGVCSTDILVITPKEPEWFGFVLGHVSSVDFVNHADATSTGTKMPRTNWKDMARYEIALPPRPLAAIFTEQIRPLVERIIANIHESCTLAAIRDALLPKLLSGEISVKVAEKVAGKVRLRI